MRLNSPQTNLIIKACMKASRSLIRDFGEIENLQVSQNDKIRYKLLISNWSNNPRNLKTLILGDPDNKNRSTVTLDQLDVWIKKKLNYGAVEDK